MQELKVCADRTLANRIRVGFPSPIADRYAALCGADHPGEQINAIVLLFRCITNLLGVLSIACVRASGIESAKVKARIGNLDRQSARKGLSDGQWLEILRELNRPFVLNPESSPMPELVGTVFRGKREADCVKQLNAILTLRNSIAHGHGGSDTGGSQTLQKLDTALERLFPSLAFLEEYAFVALRDLREESEGVTVIADEFSGVSPKAALPKYRSHRSMREVENLTIGDVYALRRTDHRTVRISPFAAVSTIDSECKGDLLLFQWLPPEQEAMSCPLHGSGTRCPETHDEIAKMSTAGDPVFQDLPTVGRERELETLSLLLKGIVSDATGGTVVIDGPGGSGKTHITKQFAEEVSYGVGRVIRTEFHPNGEPWSAVRNAVESLFGITNDLSRSEATAAIRDALQALGDVDTDEIDAIADFVHDPVLGSTPGDDTASQLVNTLARVIWRMARIEPIVFIFENLQWADDQSCNFIEYTARLHDRAATAVGFVVTINSQIPEDDAAVSKLLRGLKRHTPAALRIVALEPLSEQRCLELIKTCLGSELDIGSDLARFSHGNPSRVLMFLQYLLDEAKMERKEGGWCSTLDDPELLEQEFSQSMHHLVEARIDALGKRNEHAETVLKYASATGARFPYELLVEIMERDQREVSMREVDDCLDMLLAQGVLDVREQPGGVEFVFPDGATHRAILEITQRTHRWKSRSLYRTVAETKREFFRKTISERAAEIAEDFDRAGEHVVAFELNAEAVRVAVGASNYEEAVRLSRSSFEQYSQTDEPELSADPAVSIYQSCALSVGSGMSHSSANRSLVESWAATDAVSSDARKVIAFLTWAIQHRQLSGLWEEAENAGRCIIASAERQADVETEANVYKHLGSLIDPSGPDAKTRISYLAKASELLVRHATADGTSPDDALRDLETSSWSFVEAQRIEEANTSIHRYLELVDRCSAPLQTAACDIRFSGLIDLAVNSTRIAADSETDPASRVEEAREHLRHAAEIAKGNPAEAVRSVWIDTLITRLEATGTIDLGVGDEGTGDVLLIHNPLDRAGVDLVRAALDEMGVSTCARGPENAGSPQDIEAAFGHIVIFGSVEAPNMQKFAYLFLNEKDTWKTNLVLGQGSAFHGYWLREKTAGKGFWCMAAGTTRYDTLLAARTLARDITAGVVAVK